MTRKRINVDQLARRARERQEEHTNPEKARKAAAQRRSINILGCGIFIVLGLISIGSALINNAREQPVSDVATQTVLPSPTLSLEPMSSDFDGDEVANNLSAVLAALSSERRILSVVTTDERAQGGNRTIVIIFLTTEVTYTSFLNEWIELFTAVADYIQTERVDVDLVVLAPTTSGVIEGNLAVRVSDLLAFFRGEMTRDAFLGKVDMRIQNEEVTK